MHYVCSDIHGQIELYKKLIEKITEDDTLYVIGDVIDRGPDSIGILRDMMKRPNVELFLGNHELMMIDYYRRSMNRDIWFYGNNGGQKTYEQLKNCSGKEQETILEYIRDAWIQKYVTIGDTTYCLSHSFFLPDRRNQDVRFTEEIDEDAIFDAVWNSPYRLWEYASPEEYDDGSIHITGHIPVQNLDQDQPPHYNKTVKESLIDIDGGCSLIEYGIKGGLYCMSLETDEDGKRKEFWFTME